MAKKGCEQGVVIHFMVTISFQKPGVTRLIGNMGGGEPGELLVGLWTISQHPHSVDEDEVEQTYD
jgi:hypothetical protein